MLPIQAALTDYAFEHLFIECLGWDRVRIDNILIAPGDSQFSLQAIAQKRGFIVFTCPTHRTVLANRQLLRAMQKIVRKSYHEHIIIHYCDTPRKQVWQWAIQSPAGRGILHREHPFFSSDPPPRLLERLGKLSVAFEEEEGLTLTDVLARVREVLLPDSELNLFAKWPSYATKSDALALAVKRGEPGAFDKFVQFHMPLARKASRMLIRWFDMTPEDAEQTAMIGLLEAARRFDPRQEVGSLEESLSDDVLEDRLTSILQVIGSAMSDWSKRLDLEHSESPVGFDLRNLTVVAYRDSGPIRMSQMGSGENWMGYHVITHLALHKWFAEQHRPVPGLLMFDQPTQVYFPAEPSPDRSLDDLTDDDRAAVRRLFDFIFDVVNSLSPKLQVIITDHADLNEAWFQEAVKERWRSGVRLVPSSWYEQSSSGSELSGPMNGDSP